MTQITNINSLINTASTSATTSATTSSTDFAQYLLDLLMDDETSVSNTSTTTATSVDLTQYLLQQLGSTSTSNTSLTSLSNEASSTTNEFATLSTSFQASVLANVTAAQEKMRTFYNNVQQSNEI